MSCMAKGCNREMELDEDLTVNVHTGRHRL